MLTGGCWQQLTAQVPGFRPLPESNVLLIGARDLDPLERDRVEASALRMLPAASSLGRTLEVAMTEGDTREVYLHLDLDVLDPSEGRANVFAAPGGYTREALLEAIEAIQEGGVVGVAGITAYDPECDVTGGVGRIALEVAERLVGGANRALMPCRALIVTSVTLASGGGGRVNAHSGPTSLPKYVCRGELKMALQIHRTDESVMVPHTRQSVIPAGTGRLGLVSAYFLLMTLVAAGVACVSALLALVPGHDVRLIPMLRPSVAMICAIVLSFTSFQTARLIDEHRRSGAVLATGWFLLLVISYTQHISGIITLALAVVGFGIMASAWRYLR